VDPDPRPAAPSPANGASSRRPAHRPSRRDAIVEAAIREFTETGLSGATIGDVANRAGVSPAAVYYHFPTREDLLIALVRRIGADVEACAALRPGDDTRRGAELIDRVFRDYQEWIAVHPGEARLLWVEAAGRSPVVEAARRETVTGIVERTVELFDIAGFELAPTVAEVTALGLVTVLLATMELDVGTAGPAVSDRQLRHAMSTVGRRLLGSGTPVT